MSVRPERPRPTLLYRLTHVANLAMLAQRGGIHAPAHVPDDGFVYRGIHDQSIRARRGARTIPCGPGGTVDDYVSFYLCPRSPMLYRIQKDPALRAEGGIADVVHLVTSAERVFERELGFVVCDGHGLQTISRYRDDAEALDALDWESIEARQWRRDDDPDLARRKQAEFLVHELMPWEALLGIGCANSEGERKVRTLLASTTPNLDVKCKPDWYYD